MFIQVFLDNTSTAFVRRQNLRESFFDSLVYHCIPGTRLFDNFSVQEKLLASTTLYVPHDAICLPHKILHKLCLQFLNG